MKKIYLGKNRLHFTLVDDEDYEFLSQWNWGYDCGYARREIFVNGKKHKIWMHREIMRTPENMMTDHINLNRLDNQKHNLRTCTRTENIINRKVQKNNGTGYKGVSKVKNGWVARIMVDKVAINLGQHPSPEDAAKAYDIGALHHFGEFANTNFPKEHYK